MTTYVTVGKSATRVEGPDKVAGLARYPADVLLPGALWGKVLRSPLPHARIVHIDGSRARQVPGVHAVITAADIPDTRVGRRLLDFPVLARDKVRFIGEKVAAGDEGQGAGPVGRRVTLSPSSLRINSAKGLGCKGGASPPRILHPDTAGFRMTASETTRAWRTPGSHSSGGRRRPPQGGSPPRPPSARGGGPWGSSRTSRASGPRRWPCSCSAPSGST